MPLARHDNDFDGGQRFPEQRVQASSRLLPGMSISVNTMLISVRVSSMRLPDLHGREHKAFAYFVQALPIIPLMKRNADPISAPGSKHCDGNECSGATR